MGLFAKTNIKKDTNLGVSHISIPHSEEFFAQQYCRTPLGGFYNHSETPNCKTKLTLVYFYNPKDNIRLVTKVMELITIRKIEKGEELTCKYTLYELDNKNE